MPDYINEPAFQTIIQSPKVMRLKPEKRQEFLKLLGDLSPQERQQFADGLGSQGAPEPSIPAAPSDRMLEGTTMQDTSAGGAEGYTPEQRASGRAAIRGLGADVAGMAINMALPMTLPARAGNLLRAGVDVGASVLGGKTSQVLQGGSLAPNWSDAMNAAIPAAVHGAAAVYRGSHFLAGRAVRESDAAANALDEANQGRIADYNSARASAETAADTTNAQNQAAYQTKITETRYNLKQKLDQIQKDVALTNQERAAANQAALQEYRDTLVAHNKSFVDTPAAAKAGIQTGDYRLSYENARSAAQGAQPVDPTPLNETAKDLGVSLRQPAPGLQSKFSRITDALQEFGTDTGEVPLERLFATQKALGRVIGKSNGEELGAAKKLFSTTVDMLDAQSAVDPAAAAAIQHQREAAKSFMRTKVLEDFDALFGYGAGVSKVGAGQVALNPRTIHTNFEKWLATDEWATKALTTKEIDQMRDALETTLPKGTVGQEPTPQPMVTAKASKYPVQGPASYGPPPKTIEPEYPNPPKMDTSTPPTPLEVLGPFPIGQAILGKVGGAGLGGLAGEASGAGTYKGIVGGGITGSTIASAPWLIARLRLSGPEGEAIVRNIMAGKSHVNSTMLAALTSAARSRGIVKTD